MQNYSQDNVSTANSYFKEVNSDVLFVVFLLIISLISAFGRWVTKTSSKGKGRVMKKYGWWLYFGTGLILTAIITWIIANFILSLFVSYLVLLIGVLISLYGKT